MVAGVLWKASLACLVAVTASGAGSQGTYLWPPHLGGLPHSMVTDFGEAVLPFMAYHQGSLMSLPWYPIGNRVTV